MDTPLEETKDFKPKLNADGLIGCIVQHANSRDVLMFAWMNEESLKKTLQSGEMHFWSRSRQSLWHKGATSGGIQKLKALHIDCDQDCLLALVDVDSNAKDKTCHTNRETCFYRTVEYQDGDITLKLDTE